MLCVVAFDAAMGVYGDAGVVAAVQDDEIACEGEDVESRVDDGDDVALEGWRDDLLLQACLCRTSSLINSKSLFFLLNSVLKPSYFILHQTVKTIEFYKI